MESVLLEARADSSPAQVVVESPAPAIDRKPLADLTPTERYEWRKTGQRPPVSEDASAVADQPPSEPVVPASTDASLKPDSAPAKPKNKTEERFQTLLKERKDQSDRAERAERRIAELERSAQPPVAASLPSASLPAGLIEPDPNNTTKYPGAQYDPQFIKDIAAFNVQKVLHEERAKIAESDRLAAVKSEWKKTVTAFNERVEAVAHDLPDFKAVALEVDSVVPRGSTADLAIWEDENGPRMLYHLQKNPAEVSRILKLSVWNQVKELARLSDKLGANPSADASTSAPTPFNPSPTRVAPTDPLRAAMKSGNTGEYIRLKNEEELSSRRRRRA